MTAVHSALAFAAAAGVVVLLAAAAATWTGALASRRWLDRAILVQAVTGLAAAIAGVGALLARPPSDALHLVYGAVLVMLGLGARYLARDTATRRLGGVMTVVALVLAGVVVRSFMTGN